MNKVIVRVALAAILGAAGLYYYWQRQAPVPAPLAEAPTAVSPPAAEPAIHHPIGVGRQDAIPLPGLDQSDPAMRESLGALVGPKLYADLFYPDRVVRRAVATVDNLSREKASGRVMPVKPVPGAFLTEGTGDKLTIAPANAARYSTYVHILEAADTKKLVDIYERFYPLFQQAYQDLGYPQGYFNDRLVQTIDDLLAAPDMDGARLNQSKVLYTFADPDLESRSAGQKVLMRMGRQNEDAVKSKLRDIRAELARRAPQEVRP